VLGVGVLLGEDALDVGLLLLAPAELSEEVQPLTATASARPATAAERVTVRGVVAGTGTR
jgi:hypothetical protein